MKKKIILCFFIYSFSINCYKAVISVPVVDAIGKPFSTNSMPHEKEYNTIPFCGGLHNPTHACPRLHQLLYNDIVEVLKIVDNQACIQISSAFYRTTTSSTPQTSYWILAKNLIPLDTLTRNNIHIPQPIDFNDTYHTALHDSKIVTLYWPHYDKKCGVTFSAGTRFVCSTVQHKKNYIHVFACNYTTMQEYCIAIPKDKCMVHTDQKSHQQRITEYVALLQQWTQCSNGFIPYTWGGTSFTATVNETYTEKELHHEEKRCSYYQFATYNPSIKTGLDCSGAILRAAHICGIPYFCKNSFTIMHTLSSLSPHDTIQIGDLIVVRGHVMVVSSLTNDTLIESRSYAHGYGKLHELPLSDVFMGIQTYADLADVYSRKKTVQRIDRTGKVRDSFDKIMIVRMASS